MERTAYLAATRRNHGEMRGSAMVQLPRLTPGQQLGPSLAQEIDISTATALRRFKKKAMEKQKHRPRIYKICSHVRGEKTSDAGRLLHRGGGGGSYLPSAMTVSQKVYPALETLMVNNKNNQIGRWKVSES